MNEKVCQSPISCKAKHESWLKNQEKWLLKEDDWIISFVEKNDNGIVGIENVDYTDKHFNKRCVERGISIKDVSDVLRYGWVIETFGFKKTQKRFTMLGYVGENKRPLHVVFEKVGRQQDLHLVTAYTPMSMAHKWGNNYQERVCFCQKDYL